MKNLFGKSITDILKETWKAKAYLMERMQEFTIWKSQHGYKRMNKKRWELWLQQNKPRITTD